jgi:hypothetical protein
MKCRAGCLISAIPSNSKIPMGRTEYWGGTCVGTQVLWGYTWELTVLFSEGRSCGPFVLAQKELRKPTEEVHMFKFGLERQEGVSGQQGHALTLINPPPKPPEQTGQWHPGNELTSARIVEVKSIAINSAVDCLEKGLGGVKQAPSWWSNYPSQGRPSPQNFLPLLTASLCLPSSRANPIPCPLAVVARTPLRRGGSSLPRSPRYRAALARPVLQSEGRQQREVSPLFCQFRC